MLLKFKPGDVIQNIEPYENESPKLIISFTVDSYIYSNKEYKEPNSEWDLNNFGEIFFEDTHTRYHKIGFIKINLNVTVEEK